MATKYLIHILILSFLFTSCQPNYGSLTGNAYWEYNRFVGNKADAGSKVYLFSSDTSESVLKATCDVQGNFKFDKLTTGDYMLVLVSKNTTTSALNQLQQMTRIDVNKYFGFSFEKIDSTLFKEAGKSLSDFEKSEVPPPPGINGYEEKKLHFDSLEYFRNIANKLADSLFNKIPKHNKLLNEIYSLGSFSKKVKFRQVTIKKNETSNEIFDFGITYF